MIDIKYYTYILRFVTVAAFKCVTCKIYETCCRHGHMNILDFLPRYRFSEKRGTRPIAAVPPRTGINELVLLDCLQTIVFPINYKN